MIIVNPYHVIVFNVLRNNLGKHLIGFGIGVPGVFIERDFVGVVVEEWPEDRVYNWLVKTESARKIFCTREAIVVPVGKIIVKHNGYRAILFLKLLLKRFDLCLWDLEARPTVPLECRSF
jgi:hypothetical protein